MCAPSAGTHRLRGSRRTATPSPSRALFRNVLEGTRTSPNVSKVLSFPSSAVSVRSSSSPTLTVASSGLHRHTLIVPRISSPDSNPPTIASLSQCGAKTRALFPPPPASEPKPKSFRSSSAFIAASFASLTDSNAFMTSSSFEWNRGKYWSAARTSTPGGRRLRISPARLTSRLTPPFSVEARSSERTTTGNAPRTFPAYHAAARSTGSWNTENVGFAGVCDTPASSFIDTAVSASPANSFFLDDGASHRLGARSSRAATTDVCTQCSFGNNRRLRRRSLYTSRSLLESRVFPRRCTARASDCNKMMFFAASRISRKSTYSAMLVASGTR